MKIWKITSKKLKASFENWQSRKKDASDEMLRFSRRNGGSRNVFGFSETFGRTSVYVKFTKDPDPKLWKSCGDFWLPKASGKKAKSLLAELKEIRAKFPSRDELMELIGIKPELEFTVRGATRTSIGYLRIEGDWYVKTHDSFSGAKGIRRISDVQWEKIRDEHA